VVKTPHQLFLILHFRLKALRLFKPLSVKQPLTHLVDPQIIFTKYQGSRAKKPQKFALEQL